MNANNKKEGKTMKIYQVTDYSTGEVFQIEAESAVKAGEAFRKQNKAVKIELLSSTEEKTMNKPKVHNKHKKTAPADAVYIGRGSKWGNPFIIDKDGSRSEVIAKYEEYILGKPELLAHLHELKGKDLECFCAPQACHGDVLVKLANNTQEKTVKTTPETTPVVWNYPSKPYHLKPHNAKHYFDRNFETKEKFTKLPVSEQKRQIHLCNKCGQPVVWALSSTGNRYLCDVRVFISRRRRRIVSENYYFYPNLWHNKSCSAPESTTLHSNVKVYLYNISQAQGVQEQPDNKIDIPEEEPMKTPPENKQEKPMKTTNEQEKTMKKFIIAGTGTRSLMNEPQHYRHKVLNYLVDLLVKAKEKHGDNLLVISGMAEGFDEALARAAVKAGVPFIAAVPNPSYINYYWTRSVTGSSRLNQGTELLSQASEVVYVCKTHISDMPKYNGRAGSANFERNEWMADRADVVWAFHPVDDAGNVLPLTSGTKHCVNYATQNNISVFKVIVNKDDGGSDNAEGPASPPNNPKKEEPNMKPQAGFKGTYLSNFWPAPVEHEGLTYPTVENFYQAMRLEDRSARKDFVGLHPAEAKKKGRAASHRKDWNPTMAEAVMLYGLRQKFFAGSELANKLLATGNEELVETNYWHDMYWGKCTCTTCKGEGQNKLGVLLMQVRDELRNNNGGGETPDPIPNSPEEGQDMNKDQEIKKEAKPMKTQPPSQALEKRELLTSEEVQWITAKLEEKILPVLKKDISAYAPGRQRIWMPYQAPLDSQYSQNEPFTPGVLDDEIWQWIVDLCAKHGFKADTCLISKGGNIKPHRDTTFAAPWAMGINLGVCDWHIAANRQDVFDWNEDGSLKQGARLDRYGNEVGVWSQPYSMSLNGGEVFKFNSKHIHAVTNAAPDRWSINVWAISDGPAAISAGIPERRNEMLENHPEVHEFIDFHKPGATNKTTEKETTMKEQVENNKETNKQEEIMDTEIREYVVVGCRPNVQFDWHSKSFVQGLSQEWRIITNDLEHFFLSNKEYKIEKYTEVSRGSYYPTVLAKIFNGVKFAVEIASMKSSTGKLMPGYTRSYKVKQKNVLGIEEWTTVFTPKPHNYFFGWADLDSETVIFCENKSYTPQAAGLIIGNSSKATKRFAEIVRFAVGSYVNEEEPVKKLVLKEDQLMAIFKGLTKEQIKAAFDGCSIISPWLVKKIYKSNPALNGRELSKRLSNVDNGIETNWTFRCVTNIDGQGVMIKGNAIVAGKKMHKRLRDCGIIGANEYYDIITFEWNVKPELGTDGTFETLTIEAHHGPNYVRTNDQIAAQYYGIRGIMDPTELLEAWKLFLNEAVESISRGEDISWMLNIGEERAETELDRLDQIRRGEGSVSILNHQIAQLHRAGLTIGVSQSLMNMRANGVRLANLGKEKLNEGFNLDFNESLEDVDLFHVFTNWETPAKQKKANMVMPWAYRAYVMTKELIWLAGHSIDVKNEATCSYHPATQTFAMSGAEWARIAPILGGADLDDEIMIMERLIVELDGTFGIKAFLLRSPNDWAEFAIVDIAGPSGEARIAYGDMPTLWMKDLQKFNTVPVTGHLPSVVGHVSNPWLTRPTPAVYDKHCAAYMWRAAAEMDLGVGGQVKVKMLQYGTAGAFDELPCPNDEMIDALQAPTGTIDDMKVLNKWEKEAFIDVVKNGVPMDKYWWTSRKVGKSVGKWLEQGLISHDEVTWPLKMEESPIVRDLMIPRQIEVMAAYKKMLKILNNQIVEIIDLQDVFDSTEEKESYIARVRNKSKEFISDDSEVVATETLESIIKYYNTDKEACYKFVLKMARASYLIKSQYISRGWDGRQCFDQWLYYGVMVDGITGVDIFCEALEWYRAQGS